MISKLKRVISRKKHEILLLPPNEADRIKALHSYQILDTVAEQAFDDLVVLAAHICNTPIALVSLVDAERQWFKAKIGLAVTETPRELAFCAHAILQPDKLLVVPNTLEDERFATNPLVTSEPKIRFYAGIPLTTSEGYGLGTLCVIDHVPRNLNLQQVEALKTLGRQVSAQLELRRKLSNLVQLNQVLREAEVNLQQALLHDAFHDSLTRLPNRALLLERLGHALELALRREGYLFAVLFLDLDRFKTINDSLGHPVGDQLLLAFVQRLEPSLRSGDTLARLGGDEFVILLEDINGLNEATQVAQRVQELLSLPFNLDNHQIYTSASIGIALSTTEYQQPEDMLRDADTAMYRAKARGKACYEIFNSSMHIQALTLLQLENDLRRAIERQELQLYYQPIVSLTTGKMTGFEALARWQHPKQGPISPSKFIPVAEETGLILPLGEWVLRCACQVMRAWQVQFSAEPPLSISVNLSAKQFTQPNLIQLVSQTLQQTQLAPGSLKLEITESVLMENPQAAVSILSQLRELGIQLHIDDFGTGYSSLNYLQQFPVDALKIDRSFIAKMGVHGKNLELVQTIAMLARNLGIDVVAEGVETVEQLVQLRTLECAYGHAQGYLFSHPVDIQEATALIAAQRQW